MADRLWLHADLRLPAWDEANYINSSVDHGRALGLLPGGGWRGWQALLDLSPKIPPLGSLVGGTVIAMTGDDPDAALWVQSVWEALLLVVVAAWGRQLVSPAFGLLAAALTAAAPALAALRVDYTLDLPVTASALLALWLLGRWQAPAPSGGRWGQAVIAAGAIGAAVLVKQSALLVLIPPCLWAAGTGLGRRGRRLQVLVALAIAVGMALPWLRHNWIMTLGGTNRAVIESAAQEGDPDPFSLASLLWYPPLLPAQLGLPAVLVGLAGALLGGWRRWRSIPPTPPARAGWGWLIGCALSGWLFTTLSPNKDPRYIAPVLPLLLILLSRGWWALALWLRARWGRRAALAALGLGLVGSAGTTAVQRAEALERDPPLPLASLVGDLRQRAGPAPTTVIVIPTTADFNQNNVTMFGRAGGGEVVGRETGKRREEHLLVLQEAEWLLLATGDQGTRRKESRQLSRKVRSDGRFSLVRSWPWDKGRRVELWQRSADAPPPSRFDQRFIRLARGMERGPAGLAAVFDAIGPEHQLDGHFLYQQRVARWAEARLRSDPDDRDALWSLGLLGVLQNRPLVAARWFSRLETLEPANPWPAAYRAVVLLADWRAPQAAAVAAAAERRHPEPVLRGLADLAASLSGNVRRIPALTSSLPAAVEAVQSQLSRPPAPPR
ncbi:glycosyltransferase family 39 protein [Synechococcus sp. CCY 9618]|uniref:glycosyltransferase family 39 protein n=1 Tax=Synechococcus sp. CCY 9618 TaxID=2815602 RepID=UPI00352FCA7C